MLYWIPFVRALGLDPARLIPVTRGGAAAWYGTPSGVELFAMRTPKQCRIENTLEFKRSKSLKQTYVTAFDRALLAEVAKDLGLTKYHVLHPAWMYQTLAPFWEGQTGLEWIWPHICERLSDANGRPQLSMTNLPTLPILEGLVLPPKFVAARFYLRATYPHHEATLGAAQSALQQVTGHVPVLLLDSGIHADEHIDIPLTGRNIVKLSDLYPLTPENNLAIQSAVLSRALGFLGTYGGLSQLALRLGKPSVSFYLNWFGTALAHKHLADAIATATQIPSLVVRLGEVPLLRSVLPHLEHASSSGTQPTVQVPEQQAV